MKKTLFLWVIISALILGVLCIAPQSSFAADNIKISSITLNIKSQTITAGSTLQLVATINPSNATNKTLTWTSGNNNVATVSDEGLVTAVAGGKTTITVKATDGSKKSVICSITVRQYVSSIILNTHSITLESKGKTYKLKASVLPKTASNRNVKWTSSDNSIATVSSSGKVTSKGNGVCTITCTAADGSGISDTCSVTARLKITSIKLNFRSQTIITGHTLNLVAAIKPSNATNQTLTWTSSNKNVATVSDAGLVTAVGVGKATITVKATDGSKKSAKCSITVKQSVESVTLNTHIYSFASIGVSYTLIATVSPKAASKKVVWTSSDNTVATVSSSGKITSKGNGVCSITCTAADGSGCSDTCSVSVGKKVINIYSFTDEVPRMCAKYLELHPDFGYSFNPIIISTTDNLYEPALDQALTAGGPNAPDIYCAEAGFVLKYTQGDMSSYAMPYKDLGIDVDSELTAAQIAQYTIDVGTRTSDKALVGLGYQATGGAFIYRRSIAKDVWGTDDPATIATKIGPGWDKFFKAAAELKAKGYGIVSGSGDIWHSVENSSDAGWLTSEGKLYIDPKRESFLDYSKELKDKGYTNETLDWSEAWYADMAGTGAKPIFGFFGPAWLINYVMVGNCGGTKAEGGTYGDWAVCNPPIGFFWGGTWVLANKSLAGDTEKKAAVEKVIDWITLQCDKDSLQYSWANGKLYGSGGTKDTVASGTVMAMSDGTLGFLGGQNMYDVFVPANQFATGKNITQYDQIIGVIWRDMVRQYSNGKMTRDEAIQAFKDAVHDQLGIESD